MKRYIVALDEGTTSARAAVYDVQQNRILKVVNQPFRQIYPQAGWVEHDINDLYAAQIKALTEAEAYNGPSLIIGYAPCEMHGLKGGMTNCQSEMKRAVEAGYWQLFRFNPMLKKEGKNPFSLDSKEPTADYIDFIKGEARYSRLMQQSPERATELFEKAAENAKKKYDLLKKKVEFYEE